MQQAASKTTSSTTLYPLYDGSGNILAWTNSTGQVVSTTAYTAFGEVLSQSGSSQSYGFSTKSYSQATGLSYFGARFYRPDLARWLTPDPLGMIDGPNLYAFSGNNPVSFVDPFGLWVVVIAAEAEAGFGIFGPGPGGQASVGIAFDDKGNVGGVGSIGGGAFTGVVLSLGPQVTFFPTAQSISEVAGSSLDIGAQSPVFGGGRSAPFPGSSGPRGYTISGPGLGGGIGVNIYAEVTKVWPWFKNHLKTSKKK